MENKNYEKYEIFDAHAHIFPEKIADAATVNIGRFYDLKMRNTGVSERLLESGAEINTVGYLVFSTATAPRQVRSINGFIAGECAAHSEFIGLGTLHPLSENIEDELDQLVSLGLHGVKLHPDFQDFSIDAPEAYPMYEMLEGKMPVLIHCGDRRYERSAPKKIAAIHRDFPKLKIIAAHLGGYERWTEAQKYLAGLDNVWFDTSSSLPFLTTQTSKRFIENLGTDRCFFGTDFPMWRHSSELKLFLSLGFSEKENRMILSGNLKSFLGITGQPSVSCRTAGLLRNA